MREYKFRVWNRKMTYFGFKDIDTDADHTLAQVVNRKKDDLSYGCIDCEESTHYVMQYTGLKDKNGKEIYEGDVVRYKAYNTQSDEWEMEMTVVKYIINGYTPFKWEHDMSDDDDYYTIKYKDYEVVGNIYENPEFIN